MRSDVIPAELVRAAVEGVVGNLRGAAEAVGQSNGDGRVFLVEGAAPRIVFQRLFDLTDGAIAAPFDEEVATRAAVWATAGQLGDDFADVSNAWKLGRGEIVRPHPVVDCIINHEAVVAEVR